MNDFFDDFHAITTTSTLEEVKEKSRTIFDVFNTLSKTKEIIPSDEFYYNSFLMNRIFAKFPDTLFLANEMNALSFLPVEVQMDFYRTACISKSRFAKWFKAPPDIELVKFLMMKLEITKEEAICYLDILSEEDKKNLIPKTGGLLEKPQKQKKKTK